VVVGTVHCPVFTHAAEGAVVAVTDEVLPVMVRMLELGSVHGVAVEHVPVEPLALSVNVVAEMVRFQPALLPVGSMAVGSPVPVWTTEAFEPVVAIDQVTGAPLNSTPSEPTASVALPVIVQVEAAVDVLHAEAPAGTAPNPTTMAALAMTNALLVHRRRRRRLGACAQRPRLSRSLLVLHSPSVFVVADYRAVPSNHGTFPRALLRLTPR